MDMKIDGFNKLLGLEPTVESDAPAPASPTPEPGGVADMASMLEQAPESNVFSEVFAPLDNPSVDYDQSPIATVPGFQELLAPSEPSAGKVNWDSILQMKQEIMKDNPDWQSVFQSLQNMSLPDRIATLAEMSKEGDLSQFIQKLPPEAHQALADFLQPLVSTQGPDSNPPLSDVLRDVFTSMNDGTGKFADTVRSLCHIASPAGHFDQTNQLVQILDKDPAPEHRLYNMVMMKELEEMTPKPMIKGVDYPHPPGQLYQMIDIYLKNFLNGSQTIPPPGLSEVFQNDPAWAARKLVDIVNSSSMVSFVNSVRLSGDNIGPAFGGVLSQCPDHADVSNAVQEFLQNLLKQNGPMADDIVRDMVNSGAKLDSLSPGILIEMKLILQNGDDAALNASALDSVNQAYQAVK